MQQRLAEVDDQVLLTPIIAGTTGAFEGSFERSLPPRPTTLTALDNPKEAPGVGQTAVVGKPFERRECLVDQFAHACGTRRRVADDPDQHDGDPRAPLCRLIIHLARRDTRLIELDRRGVQVAGILEGFAEIEKNGAPSGGVRREQSDRPLEKRDRRGDVAPYQRPVSGMRKSLSRPPRERGALLIDQCELDPIAVRALQVVGDDLLDLGQPIAGLLLEPVGEALVQLRAQPFAGALVGGIANERVFEAERGVVDKSCLRATDEITTDKRRKRTRNAACLGRGRERDDGAEMEDLALDSAPLRCGTLGLGQAVEPGGEQRAKGGRNGGRIRLIRKECGQLLREEGVAPAAPNDRFQVPCRKRPRSKKQAGFVLVQHVKRDHTGPVRTRFQEFGPRSRE